MTVNEEFNHGNILVRDISEEVRTSFLDYSMSVIVSRALPDVRDGLKPVHRRILYSMFEQGVTPDKPYKKSARTVGDVMAKYHPHGDAAIYDAMVRLAQDFSMRYPLVDGQGNFGSIDGDGAAASRYTEARLNKYGVELMNNLEKDTVDMIPNYDGEELEPSVLPSALPNLLLNGSAGIAVGMATNIPPHNLREVTDAIEGLIDDPEMSDDDLLKFVKGPDFPTGATILGSSDIRQAYLTGRGSIKVRAKAHIEVGERNRNRIIVTEIPYQVNKARLIERIGQLVRDKKLEGISDLRDESNREGMRIVIELKNDAVPQVVLNHLYKQTQLQDNFGVIMLALVNGVPRVLSLREVLNCYIDHQKEVVTRRCRFDLKKAQDRAHILEGLRIALDYIDEVVATIRAAKSTEEARQALMLRFALTERQANAILEMRLRALTGLERDKVEAEYLDLIKTIAYLEQVLSSERMVLNIIKEELERLNEKYGDARRTAIVNDTGDIDDEDLIAEEDMVITISHTGYIKRLNISTYRSQKRGGKGVTAMTTRDEDFVQQLFVASTHHYLLVFTNRGRCFRLKVHEIPEAGRTAKGTALVNLLPLDATEKVRTVLPIREFDSGKYLFMATRNGTVKKTPLKDFNSRTNGIIAISLADDDDLIGIEMTDGNSDMILCTAGGMSIRFAEADVRSMGRTAAGVRGITIGENDHVIGLAKVESDNDYLLVISEHGYGKRTLLDEENYRVIHRGGKGVYTMRCSAKTGALVDMQVVSEGDEIMLVTKNGLIIRVDSSEISQQSRVTQGVLVMRMGDDDAVVDIAKVDLNEGDEAEE